MNRVVRHSLFAACFLAVWVISSSSIATEPKPDPPSKAADEIIDSLGLKADSGCLHFIDRRAVRYRKDKWAAAVRSIAESHPGYFVGWIIGAEQPPQAVIDESLRQKDCLIERLVADAVSPGVDVIIDYEDRWSKKSEMKTVKAKYERSARFNDYFTRRLTRSHLRDARTQSWIWKRKFDFRNRAFNRVSERASEKCELTEGIAWNPNSRRHRECWKRTLSPTDRELEILVASSAPGISRHHWGTEFDLFSLNPRNFGDEARMVDEWRWMTEHAYEFGFFQPYTQGEHGKGYMEERWHWSYYPIAQALTEWAHDNQDVLDGALNAQWDAFEERWSSRGRSYFDFVRANWRSYVFTIDTGTIDDAKR